jgi:hypothetical protein
MPQSPIPLNRPGEDNRKIKFQGSSWDPEDVKEQVLYLEDGSLHLRLHDLEFRWFETMLRKTPRDLDLATLLRERALQYDGCGTELKRGRKDIAPDSLEYIQVSNINIYIFHYSLIRFGPWSLPEVWHTISKARSPPRHRRVHYLQKMRIRFRRR